MRRGIRRGALKASGIITVRLDWLGARLVVGFVGLCSKIDCGEAFGSHGFSQANQKDHPGAAVAPLLHQSIIDGINTLWGCV